MDNPLAIVAGQTYKSPKYSDKYIEVLAIDKEDATSYTLAILWVDKTNLTTAPDDIVVTKLDAALWTVAEF
jgi:hypothetical protein